MIKFGKNTTPSEKYVKLAEKYTSLEKEIQDKQEELYNADPDFHSAIRSQIDNIQGQKKAMQPDIYREFFRMFDKKYFKYNDLCREPAYLYIDNVKFKKRRGKNTEWPDIYLDDKPYVGDTTDCKYLRYDDLTGTYSVQKMYLPSEFAFFLCQNKITEITKEEFEAVYKKAFSSEQVMQVHSNISYAIAFLAPSKKLKETKNYKELANFLKTVKLREKLVRLKMDRLIVKDNKKTKLSEITDKEARLLVTKAFDNRLADIDRKIDKKEQEIAKRCGEAG